MCSAAAADDGFEQPDMLLIKLRHRRMSGLGLVHAQHLLFEHDLVAVRRGFIGTLVPRHLEILGRGRVVPEDIPPGVDGTLGNRVDVGRSGDDQAISSAARPATSPRSRRWCTASASASGAFSVTIGHSSPRATRSRESSTSCRVA